TTANAYNHVYRLAQDLFRSWDKLIRPTFLPALSWERERVGEEDAWQFTNTLINIQVVLLAVLTVLLMVFPYPALRHFTKFQEVEATSLAVEFLVYLAPAVFFLSLAVTGYMLLNSYKRFQLAAFGDHVFVKLTPLVVLAALWHFFGIYALITGVVAGTLAKLALYIWGLRHQLKHYRLKVVLRSPAMRKMLWLMLPLLVGVLFSFGRNRFEDYFLTQVRQGSATTIVTYAKSLVDIPIQLFPVALSIAIFPFLSGYFLEKRHEELFAILGKGVRMILLVFLPLTVGLILLAHPVIDVVFGGGKYTPEDVRLTAAVLQYYAIGYVVFGLEILLLQFFYAAHDTVTPTITGVVTSVAQIVILYLVVDSLQIISFTLAFSVSKTLKVLILLVLLVRVYPYRSLWVPMLRRTGRAVLKITLAAAVMGVVVYLLSGLLASRLPTDRTVTGILHLFITVGTGGIVFIVGVHLLGVEEWRQALDWLKGRLGRR
ncbi:MAG TPA: oligosaccharide flippase family protein, partial [Planctomycetota bacterium]|nr:oligosaccharide flippase family protein [Planctomycetota bacterium]